MAEEAWKYLRLTPEDLAKEHNRPFDAKKNVWVPDRELGYIAAEIKFARNDTVTIVNAKGVEATINKDQCSQMNPPKFSFSEDMADLTHLNEASVLNNLAARYAKYMIYTYSGLFCVVVNPYKSLPIYTSEVCEVYQNKRRGEVPPHLFSIADEAYSKMRSDAQSQSILITGESGAGKTENTKRVISYYATIAANGAAGTDKMGSLETQIVQTNPVLEAFGNAKTMRNNNSSRFGKFVRMWFDPNGTLIGGDIEHCKKFALKLIQQVMGQQNGSTTGPVDPID